MAYNVTNEDVNHLNETHLMTVPEGCINFSLPEQSYSNYTEDIVSSATVQNFKVISNIYILTPLLLLSVPSNVINMIVLWKQGIRERINLCLFFLSLADLIVMVSQYGLMLDRIHAMITKTPLRAFIAKYIINNMIHSAVSFIYISGFLSTLIALERCMCVVFPLKARSMVQTKTTAIIIAAGHVVIYGAFFVIAKRWTVVCFYSHKTGNSVDARYPSQFYLDNKNILDVFDGAFFGFLLPAIFVIGVAVCTGITVVKLRQMKNWRQQSSSASSEDKHGARDITVTRMLVGSGVLFVACSTPPLVFRMLRPFLPELSLQGKMHNTFNFLLTMQQQFSYVNSSFNFFVYFWFGTKFRMTVKRMFCGCLNQGEEKANALQ